MKAKFQISLFERQKEIRAETFEILNDTHSIVLALFTGYGKSIYSVYNSCKIGLKVLVLSYRKVIDKQWIKTIKASCGQDVKYQFLTSKCPIDKDADFYIINAINVPKRNPDDFKDIGTLILDEAHALSTEQYSKAIFSIQPKYVIALTATPVRPDGKDRVIELVAGNRIIHRGLNALFNVYKFYTGFTPKIKGDLVWNQILKDQADNDARNQQIVNIARYFITRNILILCKRKDHATKLYDMLDKYGEDVDTFMGSKDDINYECRILVATYSKGGVGFDFPKLDMLIVAGDVEEQWMQYLGRIFRREYHFPIVIDMVDKFRPLKNHSDTRINICESSGGVIKYLSG